VKASIAVETDSLEGLRWENEILQQRFERLGAERDALAERFTAAVHEVAQKGGFKQLLLETRLAAAAEEAERTELLLGETLAAARVAGGGAGGGEGAARRASDALAAKDAAIGELQSQLAAAAAAHDATLDAFESALSARGVPIAELGFIPARAAQVLGLRKRDLAAAAAAGAADAGGAAAAAADAGATAAAVLAGGGGATARR
jgi:growth arrest-specific protein 8